MGRGVGWLQIQMLFDIFNIINQAKKKIAQSKSSIRNRRFTFPLTGGSRKPRPTPIQCAPEAGRHLAWGCGGAQLGGGSGRENGSQRRGQAVRFQASIPPLGSLRQFCDRYGEPAGVQGSGRRRGVLRFPSAGRDDHAFDLHTWVGVQGACPLGLPGGASGGEGPYTLGRRRRSGVWGNPTQNNSRHINS